MLTGVNKMAKLSLKQKKAGVVNVYEVKLTVQIHHQSEREAREYLFTALENWASSGEVIAGVQFDSVEESSKRFFVGVAYPEYFDDTQTS
jgi:hypothetical protein